jgi:predicted small secreted protein
MLPILIPLVWLVVVALVVAACRTAAGADRDPGRRGGSLSS